jgi:phage-related minor tail protein
MGPPISDELRRVNELLQQTDGAKVAQLQRDMSLLMAARDNAEPGTARWQQLSDAILDADEKLVGMLSRDGEVSKNIDDLGAQMQQTFAQGLGDTISRLMRGQFDSIGQMWASLLTEMAARAVAADLGKLMFGADGKGGWWSAIGTWLMSARGNVFEAGGVTPFAAGGVVNRPTMFAYGGSNLGIMGEAGPEAIMPLKRGKDGKLGVAGGGGVVVNQVINVQAGVSRNEMMVAGEAIRRATMADIRDALRRGQLATA